MKKKSASKSAPARRSPWLAVVFKRRRLGEGGLFKLRVLIGLLLCFGGITFVLFALGRASGQSGHSQPIVQAQSCRDDVEPAFPNLRQNRHITFRSGGEQRSLERLWRRLPDAQ